MIALLATSAHAGLEDCAQGAPIAGTAGFTNARTALQTNRDTYSASAFAERQVFQQIAAGEQGDVAKFAFDTTITFGASRLPVYNDSALYTDIGGDCPAEALLMTAPLDLQAENMGVAFRAGNFGGFYAASVTFGQLAESSNYVRALTWGFGYPMYAASLLALAPVVGGWQAESGVSAFAMDWIGGVYADIPKVGQLRAGYAGSTGFYASGADRWVGLFASTVLRPTPRPLDVFKGGLDRVDLGVLGLEDAGRVVGMSSVFLRDLPYGAPADPDRPDGGSLARLRTGHVQQQSLLQVADLSFAYAFAPTPLVHEWSIGLHTPGFNARRTGYDESEAPVAARVQLGRVELPAQWSLGIPGGQRFQARADVRVRADEDDLALSVDAGLLWNDPEQLALYPYAVDAVTFQLRFVAGGAAQ